MDAREASIVSAPDVKPIAPEDLDDVMAMVGRLGWQGYSVSDLALIMRVSPRHCFKLVAADRLVGAMFALTVARITYVSFFLIDRADRSLRAARALSAACLEVIRQCSDLIVVYANRRAVTAYTRFGFTPLHLVTRVRVGLPTPAAIAAASDREVTSAALSDVASLDRRCYRTDRTALLDSLSVYEGGRFLAYRRDGMGPVEGSAFVRRSSAGYVIGPLLAADDAVARRLLYATLSALPNREAVIEANRDTLAAASPDLRFEPTDVAVRKMYWGRKELLEDDDFICAIGGHHFS